MSVGAPSQVPKVTGAGSFRSNSEKWWHGQVGGHTQIKGQKKIKTLTGGFGVVGSGGTARATQGAGEKPPLQETAASPGQGQHPRTLGHHPGMGDNMKPGCSLLLFVGEKMSGWGWPSRQTRIGGVGASKFVLPPRRRQGRAEPLPPQGVEGGGGAHRGADTDRCMYTRGRRRPGGGPPPRALGHAPPASAHRRR